jgi:hypothetical protein
MVTNMLTTDDLITATIGQFQRLSGLGRSRVYEMLTSGELESVYVGARRLILINSYRRLLERQRTAVEPAPGHRRVPPRARLAGVERAPAP